MTTCVTRKGKFDEQSAFVKDVGFEFEGISRLSMRSHQKTITTQLQKLYDYNAAELQSCLTSVENLCLITDLCTAITNVKFVF